MGKTNFPHLYEPLVRDEWMEKHGDDIQKLAPDLQEQYVKGKAENSELRRHFCSMIDNTCSMMANGPLMGQ